MIPRSMLGVPKIIPGMRRPRRAKTITPDTMPTRRVAPPCGRRLADRIWCQAFGSSFVPCLVIVAYEDRSGASEWPIVAILARAFALIDPSFSPVLCHGSLSRLAFRCAAVWFLLRRSITAAATVATVPHSGHLLFPFRRSVEFVPCHGTTVTATVATNPRGGAACDTDSHLFRVAVLPHCRADAHRASAANVRLWAFATGPSAIGPSAFLAPNRERLLAGVCHLSSRSAASRLGDFSLRKHVARRRQFVR